MRLGVNSAPFKANLHAICRANLSATTNQGANRDVNGDPMRARLQSDKLADSEKSVTTSQILLVGPNFKNENTTCKRIGAKQILSVVF